MEILLITTSLIIAWIIHDKGNSHISMHILSILLVIASFLLIIVLLIKAYILKA